MPTVPKITLPDSATTDAPAPTPQAAAYNAVCRILDTIGGERWLGSGVLISPDEVLTANHVVFHDDGTPSNPSGGVATDIDVQPGYDANQASPDYTGTVAHSIDVVNEPTIAFSNIPTDFAIIHLSKPVVGVAVMRVTSLFAGAVHVTGYPASAGGSRVDSVQTITADPTYPGVLEGTTIGPGSSGGPVWTVSPGDGGSDVVVGLVSAATGTTGYFTQLTVGAAQQIAAWVAQDDSTSLPPLPLSPPNPQPPGLNPHTPSATVAIHDMTTNADVPDTLSQTYSGPVPYLETQFVDITTDNLNVTAQVANIFIHTGSGNDAVALLGGTNVVDGGTGSNFLTGGSGTDSFFVDARAIASDVWSTVNSFHSGDAATLFGITQGTQTLNWLDGDGAVGAKGLTLHATAAGRPTASLTLAGFSMADMASGKITASFGHGDSGDYLYVQAT